VRANSVAPVSVSATDYPGLSCGESLERLLGTRIRETALARHQKNAAVADGGNKLSPRR